MATHAQLTLREIHGPYMQLLTNLQGDGGQSWLSALKKFLRKEDPWKSSRYSSTLGFKYVPRMHRDMSFHNGTTCVMAWHRSEAGQEQCSIEISILMVNGSQSRLFTFDRQVRWLDLPTVTTRARWSAVRKAVEVWECTPDFAAVQLSFQEFVKRASLTFVWEGGDNFRIELSVPDLDSEIFSSLKVDTWELKPYIAFDPETFAHTY